MMDLHDELWARCPGADAGLTDLIAYHRRCAKAYDDMAVADPGHRFEALAWARIERRQAETIENDLIDLLETYTSR
nr:AMED_5909 family protein [Actinophytocola xanthii]